MSSASSAAPAQAKAEFEPLREERAEAREQAPKAAAEIRNLKAA